MLLSHTRPTASSSIQCISERSFYWLNDVTKKISLLSELIDMGLFLRHGHFISSFGFHYIVSTLSVYQDLIPFTGLKRKVKKGKVLFSHSV